MHDLDLPSTRLPASSFLPISSLLQFLKILTCDLEAGHCSSAVYIDFSKAFDSVPHERLLIKLKSLGICGPLLRWIEGFVSNRQQRVVIRGQASAWTRVRSGVPQGSVLGPLLFVIYIDDVDQCFLHSTVLKYADDIKIVSSSTSSTDKSLNLLQEDLNRLVSWSNDWLLKFNFAKCRVLHFGSHTDNFTTLHLNDFPISVSSCECDLGVYISNNLKPSLQCLIRAAASAQRLLNLVRLSFRPLDIHSLSHIYKTT